MGIINSGNSSIDIKTTMAKDVKVVHKKLGRSRAFGLAFQDYNEIHIDSRLTKKDYLTIVVHELLHIYFKDLPEEDVVDISTKMSDNLWKLNFRKVDQ